MGECGDHSGSCAEDIEDDGYGSGEVAVREEINLRRREDDVDEGGHAGDF
jgi:hypothetical protein